MYLVKDNHIRAARGLTNAIDRIQRTRRDLLLEVEVESLDQLREALRPEVDRILVDNQPPETVRRCVEEVDRWYAQNPPDHPRVREGARRWPEVEVSGGLNLDTVRTLRRNRRGLPERGCDHAFRARARPVAGDRRSWLTTSTARASRRDSRTRRLGHTLRVLETTASTNDDAWDALAPGWATARWWSALAQTRGRGRAGRSVDAGARARAGDVGRRCTSAATCARRA